jgi:hypothetical protein
MILSQGEGTLPLSFWSAPKPLSQVKGKNLRTFFVMLERAEALEQSEGEASQQREGVYLFHLL